MFGRYFKITLLAILLVEIVSLIGYYLPIFNIIGFLCVILVTSILSFYKIEYSLYFLLTELFIGGKGYLFSLEYGDTLISIRIALFILLFLFWIGKLIMKKKIDFLFSSFRNYWLFLMVFVVWGIMNAFLNNNIFSNIFFDANAWFFVFLIFPAFDIVKDKRMIKNILQILFASIFLLSLKTLLVLSIFTNLGWREGTWSYGFYRWIRETGVGEVTLMGDNFFRVFFQSQVWILVGFFVVLSFFFLESKLINKKNILLNLLLSISFAAIVISYSRSFWVGGVGALILFFIFLFYSKQKKNKIFCFSRRLLFVIFIGLFIIYLISPASIGLLGDRTKLNNESAVSSRWNLLNPLWSEVKENWLLGAGFGKTITYKTEDPRFLEISPDGLNTTYAFEWGYLDIWLKLGIGGLLAYLILLGKIFYEGLIHTRKDIFFVGLLAGLVALCITNVFSPYLNHPLGIGYIVLLSVFMDRAKMSNI